MEIQIAEKLQFLVAQKKRYKVAYGGRGGSKSFAFADCLIARAAQKHTRILCAREIQETIKDSVHKLLSDRIEFYKIQDAFEITASEIKCKHNGSLFIFKGLRTNVSEIKSMEGIDIAWVEEAQKVSDNSWNVLIPTIRNEDSEIWITFNTGNEGDPVFKRWVSQERDDTICVKITYQDNPWFPEVLRVEMERDRKFNPLRYKNVWLGEPGGEGIFFTTFGEHLEEAPFVIQQSQAEGRLFGSLDGGTTHPTSAGLWYVGEDGVIHRLMTYQGAGFTHATHAQEFYNAIESFPFIGGLFPDKIWADPALWTKVKLNEMSIRAPIDEYIDLFRAKFRRTIFEPANNNKVNGCGIMRIMFENRDNNPKFRYWQDYNRSLITSLMRVEADENNLEIYAKQDGDDGADDCRYGAVGCWSVLGTLEQRKNVKREPTHLEQLLKGKFKVKAVKADWYNTETRVV